MCHTWQKKKKSTCLQRFIAFIFSSTAGWYFDSVFMPERVQFVAIFECPLIKPLAFVGGNRQGRFKYFPKVFLFFTNGRFTFNDNQLCL